MVLSVVTVISVEAHRIDMGRTQDGDKTGEQYRGLLTEREREILSGEADVTDNYRYRVVSRVRSKINAVEQDVGVLEENHAQLLAELREVVCEGGEFSEIHPEALFFTTDIINRLVDALTDEIEGGEGIAQLHQMGSELSRGEYEIQDEEYNEILNEVIERRIKERNEGEHGGEDGENQ